MRQLQLLNWVQVYERERETAPLQLLAEQTLTPTVYSELMQDAPTMLFSTVLLRILLGTVAVLLSTAALGVWWLFLKDAPRHHALNPSAWQTADPNASLKSNPRRHMVYAAQGWLEKEKPTRAEVRAKLGPPNGADPNGTLDTWFVGCLTWMCMDGSGLSVRYEQGRVKEVTLPQF